MGKITEIKKLKRLYKVCLDGFDETDKIYVCEDTIVHFLLTVEKKLSDTDLTAVVTFDQFAQGKALAVYFISFKARTSAEVRRYLQEHEIFDEQANKVLAHLNEIGLLNDSAYAENFIQGKIALAAAGPYQIKQKLREKGISSETIDAAIEKCYDETAQVEAAIKLAEKTARSKASRLTLHQLEQKVVQTLTTKGFSYSIAKTALDSLELEADEENELDLLYNELDKAARKYARNYEGYDLRNRIIQALARKGFDFDEISRALRNYDFE